MDFSISPKVVFLILIYCLIVTGIFDRNVSDSSVKAFQHFIGVVQSPPIYPDYENFSEHVNHYLELPPFNFTNPLKKYGAKKIVSILSYIFI